MVAANHPLAAAAGMEMLAMGGNAVDAAVAAMFALTVVEPMMVSIFGAGFVNMYDAGSGNNVIVDNYTVAPAAATPDMYTPVSDTWPDYLETVEQKNRLGYLAVAVPGALKSWCYLLAGHGHFSLDTVLQPAMRYAERGFPASQYLVDIISHCQKDLARFPASRARFLPDGQPPSPGTLLVCHEYAQTLRSIAQEGADVLYNGALGDVIVRDIQAHGGILSREDLRAYKIVRRDPVRGSYRGHEIVAVGPPSAGGLHVIQTLNILEQFEIADLGFGTAASIHLIAEALKIAFADRDEYLSDPAFKEVPVRGLRSKFYAVARRRQIKLERASEFESGNPWAYRSTSGHTTHLTVADAQGNIVAMTQTIHDVFGAKVTVPGTGILLNNTMSIFDPHPRRPNSIAPGKRMVSSMAPTMVFQGRRPWMALGAPGGMRIFGTVMQGIVNVIDHGMTLQEACEAPRIWTQGQALEVEPGIAPAVRHELLVRGHEVRVVPKIAGGMNGVMLDHETGLIYGAACWRADGAPVGLSGGGARAGLFDPVYGV
ncbi:MAG: gamma-glutamyltransferase [Candidatus Tectomicrobia bacterium]|uniref:Glutathione hydrolase proenzyme n=1 Tax=Tectimicrobiota bacterium TaxID=2528274 RepID=A0A937W4K8_UNCTE|nr:gamma-glutamyltransferase [Candidatus Tectomicrobia bacterium]